MSGLDVEALLESTADPGYQETRNGSNGGPRSTNGHRDDDRERDYDHHRRSSRSDYRGSDRSRDLR
ncbi:hypothetical protein KEM55_007057, partial [Ascosphaera atra]